MKVEAKYEKIETIEVDISPSELYAALKNYTYKKHKLRDDIYLGKGDKVHYDEDIYTSHYSYRTHDVEVTSKQLAIIKLFKELGKLL